MWLGHSITDLDRLVHALADLIIDLFTLVGLNPNLVLVGYAAVHVIAIHIVAQRNAWAAIHTVIHLPVLDDVLVDHRALELNLPPANGANYNVSDDTAKDYYEDYDTNYAVHGPSIH